MFNSNLACALFRSEWHSLVGDMLAAVLLRRQPGQVPARDIRNVPVGPVSQDEQGHRRQSRQLEPESKALPSVVLQ